MAFRVDIKNAAGSVVGIMTSVKSVAIRRSLDRIGRAQITLIGSDKATADIGVGKSYTIHHDKWGTLGTFIHKRQTLGIASEEPALTIEADDELIELTKQSVHFRRNFTAMTVDSVVATLVDLVSGWITGELEADIGSTTVSYEGESVFEALDVLRDRWRVHYRLSEKSRHLDFGSFGLDSGVRLLKPDVTAPALFNNNDIALVTSLEILTEGETIINKLIPVGAGAGVTQLSLENATSTDANYPVLNDTNNDSTNYYYIEDAASQALYGTSERVMERSDVRPLTNSTADLQNAANELYRLALATLLKHKDPQTHYRVQATKLDPSKLKPGDTIRLVYRGVSTHRGSPFKWVDIDADLWIIDIDEVYSQNGGQAVSLTVGTSADRRTSDGDLLTRLMRDTKVLKSHVQPNLTHSPVGPYVKRMDSSRTATFNVRLKDEVLAVNRVLCRFITAPLRASVSASSAASGGSSAPTSDSSSIATTVAGGSATPTSGASSASTSASGGSSSPTSASGGSSSPTSASGGSSSPTSDASSTSSSDTVGSHSHEALTLARIETASLNSNHKPVYIHQDDGDIVFPSDDAGPSSHTETSDTEASHSHNIDHTHDVTISGHTHSVAISGHTHSVAISGHTHGMAHTHDVTIAAHDHSMGHTHDVTIDSHQHTIDLTYGIHEDTEHPQGISITINGTDRTIVLGGTWAPSDAAVDIEIDITEYISRGQDNTVVFSCSSGQGELTFLADCLLTIQAIVVT